MDIIDWNLLKSFTAVAETGSLSAAARTINASQPTIGRHIGELERVLGVKLFLRGQRGYQLNDNGLQLLEDARRMRDHAESIGRISAGRSQRMAGTVRVTASEIIGGLVLPGIIATLRREEPDIEIEIVASNRVDNLLRHDADIAVRMVRPHQLDLVARHVADIPLIPCASFGYVGRRGAPEKALDLLDHDVLGYDRSTDIIDGFKAMGVRVDRSFFKMRSDNHLVLWEAVRAGAGIGFNQVPLVRDTPELVTFLDDLPLPPLPIWLTMHGDLKNSPRMRFVADYLFEALRAYAGSSSSMSP